MNMGFKSVSLILALLMVLIFCSCGDKLTASSNNGNNSINSKVNSVTASETVKPIVPKSAGTADVSDADSKLSVDELLKRYEFEFFSTASGAVAAANEGKTETADSDRENAVAATFIGKTKMYVLLLQDTVEKDDIEILCDMTLNLGGKTLSFDGCEVAIDTTIDGGKTITVEGGLLGSGISIDGDKERTVAINTRTNTVIVNGGTYKSSSDELSSVVVVLIQNGGFAILNDCNIYAYSNYLYEIGKGYTASSIGVVNFGSLTMNNCNVSGTHSGIQSKGELYVNGGTYEGFGHGGFYFTGNDIVSYVENATIKDCDMPSGYTQNAGDNKAGLYIGGGNGNDNIVVYMNNCSVIGEEQPIILRGTSGEQNNTLYISNSTINKETKSGIRIDNNTHKIYIGKGNNFGLEDVKLRSGVTEEDLESMVVITNEVYYRAK